MGDDSHMVSNASVIGTLLQNVTTMKASQCCEIASQHTALSESIEGWTFFPAVTSVAAGSQCSPQDGTAFDGTSFPVGQLSAEHECCAYASSGAYPDVVGYTFDRSGEGGGMCNLYQNITGKKTSPSMSSSYVNPPPRGRCLLYSNVSGTAHSSRATSGGDKVKPGSSKLYPSWPASSPWVTSVGATRFINESVSQPEMASDQFGSGGGFSDMFGAFQDQEDAVRHYLQIATGLPPEGSYPRGG